MLCFMQMILNDITIFTQDEHDQRLNHGGGGDEHLKMDNYACF